MHLHISPAARTVLLPFLGDLLDIDIEIGKAYNRMSLREWVRGPYLPSREYIYFTAYPSNGSPYVFHRVPKEPQLAVAGPTHEMILIALFCQRDWLLKQKEERGTMCLVLRSA